MGWLYKILDIYHLIEPKQCYVLLSGIYPEFCTTNPLEVEQLSKLPYHIKSLIKMFISSLHNLPKKSQGTALFLVPAIFLRDSPYFFSIA